MEKVRNKMKAVKFTRAVLLLKLLAISNALNLHESNTGPPEILEGPLDAIVVDRSTVILTCRASGSPKPKIEWQKDGKKLQGKKYEVLPSGDLKIKPVYFYELGEYTCKAENENGIVHKSAILNVKERTQVHMDEDVKVVVAGTTANLRCDVRHDYSLSVEIRWLKDNKPIDYSNQTRFVKLNDDSLSISNTIDSDSAEYTCVARTKIDEARATANLIVENVPIAPVLKDVNCNGLEAEIIWKAKGDNHLRILFYSVEYNTSFTPSKWEVGAAEVRSSNHKFFMNPWTSYSFRVKAHNKIGESLPSEHSKTCTTPPDASSKNPENVSAAGTDPTNMVISWTPMPEIDHKQKLGNKHKVFINGLPSVDRYHVKGVAINEMGESKIPSEQVVGFSGEAPPLIAPSNFKILDLISSTSALLKWDIIDYESLRGHSMGYKLQTWTTDEGVELLREVKVANDINQILFSELRPYSKNFVRLLAYNSLSDGPGTVISIDTPEGVPSSVQNLEAHVLSPSDVLLAWDKPLRPNGRLTGYRIFYQKVQGSFIDVKLESFPYINDPLVTSGKLTGLRPDTKYRITVVGKTAMGDGEEHFLEMTTLLQTGGSQKPSKPSFKLESSTSIMVTWQPFNGIPTGTHFFTQYRIKGETEWHNTSEEKHYAYQTIDGLINNTVYEFRVVSVDGNYQTESDIQEIKTL